MKVGVAGLVFFEVYLPKELLLVGAGEEVFIEEIPTAIGGAFNTASILYALGNKCTKLITPHHKSDPLFRAMIDHIEDTGIKVQKWQDHLSERPSISIVRRMGDDRSFVSYANFAALLRCPPLPQLDWLHIAGLKEAIQLANRVNEAVEEGMQVSVSASWHPTLLAEIAHYKHQPWHFLFLNRKEAICCHGSVDKAIELLLGAARNVVITAGQEGAIANIGGKIYKTSAIPIVPLDTTGAGDGFAAGFIHAFYKSKDPMKALELAAKIAHLQLQVIGGSAHESANYLALGES